MSTTLKKLQIVGCDVRYQGSNDKGEYTIYEIAALDAEGNPVEQDLRSFDEFPLDGELREFEVTPYDHPKHGRSYTLKLPGGGGGSKSPGARLGPKVDALREQVEAQQEQIGALHRRVAELEGRLQGAPSGGLPSPASPTPDDEDIPF